MRVEAMRPRQICNSPFKKPGRENIELQFPWLNLSQQLSTDFWRVVKHSLAVSGESPAVSGDSPHL